MINVFVMGNLDCKTRVTLETASSKIVQCILAGRSQEARRYREHRSLGLVCNRSNQSYQAHTEMYSALQLVKLCQ